MRNAWRGAVLIAVMSSGLLIALSAMQSQEPEPPQFTAAEQKAVAHAVAARRLANAKIEELPEEKLAREAQALVEALAAAKCDGCSFDWKAGRVIARKTTSQP